MAPLLHGSTESPDVNRLIRGKLIRFYRVQAGLTLGQLGERIGVGPSHLSLIENGRREPKLSLLEAIATEVGVSLPQLLSDEVPDHRSALEIELEKAQMLP